MISSFRSDRRAEDQAISLKWQRMDGLIFFSHDDAREVQTSHDDAIIISMMIANYNVKRILIDNGNFANVLFYDAF